MPSGLTLKAAITAYTHTFKVGAGYIHLHVAGVPVEVVIRVAVIAYADSQQVAVEVCVQKVERTTVAFHFNFEVALGVDDVYAPQIGDVAKILWYADAPLDDIPLLGTLNRLLGRVADWLVLRRRGVVASLKQEQG